jgi:hypothetical protein
MNRIATYYRHAWQSPAQPPMVRFVVLFKSKSKSKSKHKHKHTRERYVFIWIDGDEDCRREMLRTAGRWASDARLSFTWGDAAKLSGIVRSQS